LPGITATKPGAAMKALPGISVDVVDNEGKSVGNNSGGYLVITQPWPSMTRGIYGDPERFKETYWARFPGLYFAGDGAKRDADGDLWLLGRIDDVMNISGHRLSTTEVEHALVGFPGVAEAAVVGATDDDHRSSDRRLRDVEALGRRGGRRPHGNDQRAARTRGEGHQPHRQAPPDHPDARATEDSFGQDHATTVARRRGEPTARRRHDVDGPHGRERHRRV
jgi:acyl-CoA synthetase (AMP-forming)/AMP-acid ligase II